MKNHHATRIIVALFVLQSLFYGIVPANVGGQSKPLVRKTPESTQPVAATQTDKKSPLEIAARGVAPIPAETDSREEREFEVNVDARREWFRFQRRYPFDEIPAKARYNALAQAEALRQSDQSAVMLETWSPIGPRPTTAFFDSSVGIVSGRINTIAVSPADPQLILVGGVTGGIWRSTDGGATWIAVTDDQADLAVGSIAFAPSNPSVVYAGMGSPGGGASDYLGSGVLKSIDAGQTWIRIGNAETTPVNERLPDTCITSKILVDPTNADKVFLAIEGRRSVSQSSTTAGGVYVSTNGGTNWSAPLPGAASDLALHPTNSQIVYAAFPQGLWSSINGGVSFTQIQTVTGADNAKVAVSAAAPNSVYFYFGNNAGSFLVISLDTGTNWQPSIQPQIGGGIPIDTGQFSYNNYLAVAPNSANAIYIGNRDIFRSTDGGTSWTNMTNIWFWDTTSTPPKWNYSPTNAKTHSDQQTLTFAPADSNVAYIGNDGGITKISNLAATPVFESLNQNLSLTQFIGYTIHPTDAVRSYGGSQDNGTQRRLSGSQTWKEFDGGDGGMPVLNPTNPSQVITNYPMGSIGSYTQHGTSTRTRLAVGATDGTNWRGITNERVGFYAPLVTNGTSDALYFGTYRVWATNVNVNPIQWTAFGGNVDLTMGGTDTLSAIGVERSAYSVTQTIYTGSALGRVTVSQDGGQNWTDRTAGLPTRFVKSITVKPGDPNTAYITFSGFFGNANTGHVWRTTDAGANWTDISGVAGMGGLPDIPVNSLLIDPNDLNKIYVGTDIGVFRTTVGGTTWEVFNNGIPPAIVNAIVSTSNGATLHVATYGRGAYQLNNGDLFQVTYPNTASVSWDEGSAQTVTWHIGGNAATTVNVLLSADGGQTFPFVLASGVENDGTEQVFVPDVGPSGTTQARVKVETVNNVSSDMSDLNFTIVDAPVFDISGQITEEGSPLPDAKVTISANGYVRDVNTDANGNYLFGSVPANSDYTITPWKLNSYIFGPASHTTGVLTGNVTRNFIAHFSRRIQWTQLSQVIAIQVGNPQNIQRNNHWNNQVNWNCNCVPGAYDRVTVQNFSRTYQPPGGLPLITYTPEPPTLNGLMYTVNTLTLEGGSVSGGILNLGNDIPGVSQFKGGSLGVLVNIKPGSELIWTVGEDTGGIVVEPGATLNLTGNADKRVWYAQIINNGTINWSNDNDNYGPICLIGSGTVLTNSGTLNASGNGVLFSVHNVGDFQSRFANYGTLNRTSGDGTLAITDDGRMYFTNEQNGTINVATGTVRSYVDSTIKNGTTISGDGLFKIDGGRVDWFGSINVTGNFEISNGLMYMAAPSSITSTGNRTRWTGGSLDSINPLTITAGSVFNIEGANDKGISSYGTILDNQGTINWSNGGGSGMIVLNGDGSFTNNGTFNATTGGVIFAHGLGSATPKITNNGTLRKTTADPTVELTADGRNTFHNNETGIIDVQSGTFRFTQDKTFKNGSSIIGAGKVLMDAGMLYLNGNTVVNGNLEWAGTTIQPQTASSLTGTGNSIRWRSGYINTGFAGLTITAGSVFNIEGSDDKVIGSYGTILDNQGTVNWSNGGSGGRVILTGSGAFINNGTINAAGDGTFLSVQCCGSINPTFVNNGIFNKTAGGGILTISDNGNLTTHNFGTMGANSGTLRTITDVVLKNGGRINGTGGQFLIAGGYTTVQGTTTIDGNTDNFVLGTGGNLHGANPGGGTLLGTNNGRLVWTGGWIRGGIAFGASGRMKIRSADEKGFDSAGINNSGTIDWEDGNVIFANNSTFNNLNGATFNAPTVGGFLFGGFNIYSSWFNNSGTVNIGQPNGIFGFNDGRLTFTNMATGILNVDVGGPNAGTGFDQIGGAGTMALGGTLRVNILNGYQPASGTLFPIITHAGRTGTFDTVQVINNGVPRGFSARYLAGNVSLRAFTPGTPPVVNTPLPENWFKADALAGATNSPVSSWADASGKLNDATQTDAARQPKLVTNAMNGNPVVRFDGANDQMQFDRTIENDFTITAVFQSKRGIGNTTNWWEAAGIVDGEVGGVVNDFGLALNVDGRIIAGTGNPETMAFTTPSFNDGKPHIVTFTRQKSNGESKVYVDGVLRDTKTGSTAALNAPPRLMIGSRQTDGNFLSGDIAEIITYGSLLSDADRTSINNYLTTKYISTAPQTVWNAAADFQPNRNPAFAWSYGYVQGGTFNLFTDRVINEVGAGIDRWNKNALGMGSEPSVRANPNGVTTDYHAGIRHAPDELNIHPHVGVPSVVRWTAPEAGSYLVQGYFDGNDTRNATVAVKINHNLNTVLTSPLNGFGTTISFSQIMTVAQNDTVDFFVSNGPNDANYDSTGLKATITKSATSISGRVTRAVGGTALAGMTVNLKQNGATIATATTDSGGNYAFASNLTAGANYVVEPLVEDYAFSPVSTAISNLSGNQSANFAATQIAFFGNGDFSTVTNPNGAWSYGWMPSANTTFNIFPDKTIDVVPGVDRWYQASVGTEPVVLGNRTGLPVSSGGVRLPADMLWVHPGQSNQKPVVRWTAPSSGTFRVLGRFEGIETSCGGTTIDAAVLHNAQTITGGLVIGFGAQLPFDLTLTVNAGDTIDFRTGFGTNGSYNCDSTGIAATIRPVSIAATANNIAGTLTGNDGTTPVSGAVVSLFKDGKLSSGVVTNAAGQYSFVNLETNGNYIVSAAKSGMIFKPASRSFSKLTGPRTADFTTGTPAAIPAQCVVPPANIVSWYRSEDNAADRTGGNNGTLESGVTFVDGKAGRAFDFNGTGGVALGNPANLKITDKLTIAAWVKPRPMSDGQFGVIVGKWNNVIAGDSYMMSLYKRPGGGIELVTSFGRPQDGDGGYYANLIASGAEIKPNEWAHVAMIYDAVTGANVIYINGIEVGSRTRLNGINSNDTPVYIGRRNSGGSTIPFNGAIDEPAVFNRVLTPMEIRSIMDADSAGKCGETSANTPQGGNVSTGTIFGSVNFPNVTTAGTTTFTVIDPTQGQPPAPNGYTFDPSYPAYDITTTSVYGGLLTQCMTVPGVSDPFLFGRLRILHIENLIWVDRTYSRDFLTRTICSQTTSLSPFAVAEGFGPTAASVSVSGRVVTSDGRPIKNVRIQIAGGILAVAKSAITNAFGYYRIDDIATGQSYILSASAKRFVFSNPVRVINVNDDLTDGDFTAEIIGP